MAYNVYRVETKLGMQDPLMGPETRAHNAIFLETEPNGDGQILQVTGAIRDPKGMYFEEIRGGKPERAETYLRQHYLGQIKAAAYPNVVQLLRSIPPPPRQRDFDYETISWVPCKPDKSRYGPGETVPPQRAIPALEQSGLLFPDGVRVREPGPAAEAAAVATCQSEARGG